MIRGTKRWRKEHKKEHSVEERILHSAHAYEFQIRFAKRLDPIWNVYYVEKLIESNWQGKKD